MCYGWFIEAKIEAIMLKKYICCDAKDDGNIDYDFSNGEIVDSIDYDCAAIAYCQHKDIGYVSSELPDNFQRDIFVKCIEDSEIKKIQVIVRFEPFYDTTEQDIKFNSKGCDNGSR